MEYGEFPFGANMVVKNEWIKQRHFDTGLGRVGRSLLGGEDFLFCSSILQTGGEGRWVLGAGLDHVIGPEKQTIGHVIRWYRSYGAAIAMMSNKVSRSGWQSAALLFHKARNSPDYSALARGPWWISIIKSINFLYGFMDASARQRHEGNDNRSDHGIKPGRLRHNG